MLLAQPDGPLPPLPVCKNTWFLPDPGAYIPAREASGYPCLLASLWLQSEKPAAGRKSLCGPGWWDLLPPCALNTLIPFFPRSRTRRASLTRISRPNPYWRSVGGLATVRDCGKSLKMTEAPEPWASWSKVGDSPRDAAHTASRFLTAG